RRRPCRPARLRRPRATNGPAPSRHSRARREAQVTAGEANNRSGGRPDVLNGPFTTRQLLRLDEALRLADQSTGLIFSVYVGDLDEPVRGHAEKLHAQLAEPARAVLVAVSPNQRLLEVVTGAEA